MSLSRLEQLARDPEQPMRVREKKAADAVTYLVDAYLDWLEGYHEAGYGSVSGMWIGLLPGGGGDGDWATSALSYQRQETRAQVRASELLSKLTPRQKVAVLVDTWRDNKKIGRAEACDPERWHQIICRLSLHRQPRIKPQDWAHMTADALKAGAARGRRVMERILMETEKQKSAA